MKLKKEFSVVDKLKVPSVQDLLHLIAWSKKNTPDKYARINNDFIKLKDFLVKINLWKMKK